jgi:hypothetical protein
VISDTSSIEASEGTNTSSLEYSALHADGISVSTGSDEDDDEEEEEEDGFGLPARQEIACWQWKH